MLRRVCSMAAAAAALLIAGQAQAGPVFLTGHDPDYHAQGQVSGTDELQIALNYVTGGSGKFLYVESFDPVAGGHVRGANSFPLLGLTPGTNYDVVDAAGFTALPNFSGYSAIVVASNFGAMLTDAEINALVARSGDIAAFVNAGGGLAAFAECYTTFNDCGGGTSNLSTPLFGFVPVGPVSVSTAPPYALTAFGMSLGLTAADANDCCTHNSFGLGNGLQVVDFDQNGNPTTLAGNVSIRDGGFTSGAPEPADWMLMISGLGLAGAALRRRPLARGTGAST